MRRAALLAVVLAVSSLAFAGRSLAASRPNAADLESQLVCPVCETTLDQSTAPVAERMKLYIRRRIAAGATARQIKDELVAQFGPSVLARPPKGGFGLLAWLLPLAGIAAGGVAVALLVRSWSARRSSPDEPATPLDPELERRIDDELARFDA